MDCSTHDQDSSELFLVEGDSAGGTAEGGRDRIYQAILPLRGKILNVERARLDRVLSNEEIRNIITAVGNSIGEEEDPAKRRYGKIVMMSDADVDGSHIRTLLMTFFYRQMPKLVAEGHLYVAQPPLYMIVSGKKERRYVHAEDQMQAILMETGLAGASLRRADLDDGAAQSSVIVSRVWSSWSQVLSTGCVPSAGAIGHFVTFLQWLTSRQSDGSGKPDPRDGLLPLFLVEHEGKEEKFYSEKERHAFFAAHHLHMDIEAELTPGPGSTPVQLPPETGTPAPPASSTNGHRVRELEFHEVKMLNKHLVRLRDEYRLACRGLATP